MTYREFLDYLSLLSDEQLDTDVTLSFDGEYFMARRFVSDVMRFDPDAPFDENYKQPVIFSI
jgi:hypothetical protein